MSRAEEMKAAAVALAESAPEPSDEQILAVAAIIAAARRHPERKAS